MEVFGFDLLQLFSISNLLAILIGTFVGLLFGSVPGLGVMIAIVLLLPITFLMTPLASVLMLVACYQAAEYGGSISSIILGIPGTPIAAATVLDGSPMAKNHSPGKAITYSLTSSTIGGFAGCIMLIFFSAPLSTFGLKLGDPEFFLLGILGLIGVAFLGQGETTKSLISVVLGLLFGMVGMDLITGDIRFTTGFYQLMEGIDLIALVVGMFAFSELLKMVSEHLNKRYVKDINKLKGGITFSEFRGVSKPITTGSLMGSIIGILPGLGAVAASWFSYALAKKMSKRPDTFGEGNPEGIAAPESANNASVGGSLLPMLTLGIPGSAATAMIMGAFIIHGIQPGPQVFENKNLIYGIFFGLVLSTICMYIMGRILTPLFSRALTIPNSILVPLVLLISIFGVYVSQQIFFDVWFALIIGIIFFLLKKVDYPLPPFLLAFILTPIIETGLRRALVISQGDYSIFVTRPYSLAILVLIVITILLSTIGMIRKKRGLISRDKKLAS